MPYNLHYYASETQVFFPLHIGHMRSPICSEGNSFPHLRHLRAFDTLGRSDSGLLKGLYDIFGGIITHIMIIRMHIWRILPLAYRKNYNTNRFVCENITDYWVDLSLKVLPP